MSGENRSPQTTVVIFLMIILGLIMSTCRLNRWLPLEAGVYKPASMAGAAGFVESLEVDRDNQLAKFQMADGSEMVAAFSLRDKLEWPSGCPSNIGTTHLEVASLVTEVDNRPLVIGPLSFEEPVLMRDCPGDPDRIALREDGPVGGGSACAGLADCLSFTKQSEVEKALPDPIESSESLPRSMKGYELYSWTNGPGDEWHYTLATGTNRLKTYEELTSGENVLTRSGWVKITVTGTDELKALLGRLPPGTELFWRGSEWLEETSGANGRFILPESSIVDEVQRHCRQLEIQMQVSP